MERIKNIEAMQILDSRGNPTVRVEVTTENGFIGIASVPSGASTGSFEAVELRDNDKTKYLGKGVQKAVDNVNKVIFPILKGENIYNQKQIDNSLIKLDGTNNKSKLGANAILGVSLAIAKAASNSLNLDLYKYIGGIIANKMPIPMMNILNGGKHAGNTANIQEFMIVPLGAKKFEECIEMGTNIYHSLKYVLKGKELSTTVGDEGGFAPNVKTDEEALDLIIEAINEAGYKPGKEIFLALDVASTEMYQEAIKIGKEGQYYFWKTKEIRTSKEMIEYLKDLVSKYPIISIEDGLSEEDWNGWEKLTQELGDKVQLVGDDLFVTNIERLKKGKKIKCANAILIKPNQIGTLSETLETIQFAKENGYRTIISHRSGETEDTTISDLAVATNSGQIKTGAPCRTERVAKYNRLLKIYKELNN